MNSDKDVLPVRIIGADGEEDVTIKVLLVCCITYNQLLVNDRLVDRLVKLDIW
jgi:hypothetical protein